MNKRSLWFQRFSAWAFPFRPCEPPAVKSDGEIIIIHSEVRVSFMDRLRLFFTGRCTVTTKSEVGNPQNTRVMFNALPPHHWQTDHPVLPTRIVKANEPPPH